jgi:hypothetical protein
MYVSSIQPQFAIPHGLATRLPTVPANHPSLPAHFWISSFVAMERSSSSADRSIPLNEGRRKLSS